MNSFYAITETQTLLEKKSQNHILKTQIRLHRRGASSARENAYAIHRIRPTDYRTPGYRNLHSTGLSGTGHDAWGIVNGGKNGPARPLRTPVLRPAGR